MSLRTQLRRLPQLSRLVEQSSYQSCTASRLPNISHGVFRKSFSRLSTTPTPSFGSKPSFGTQARVPPVSWKTLGVIGLAGLAVHTWLLSEAYALDAPVETEKKDPATSISFPTTLSLDGEPNMTLLGVGVRTVSFLGIKVYSVGFYADLRGVNMKALRQCKDAEECIEVLLHTTSCALRIVPTRATSYTHLRDGFIRTLQARQVLRRKDGSLVAEQEEALHTPLQQFKGLFPNSAFKKHQPLHIVLSSPSVKPRQLRIPPLGTVQDSWIATEFFRAYFHGTISPPLIEDVKQNVDDIRLTKSVI